MWNKIKTWFKRRYSDPFTVAVDSYPYWTPFNTHERLFHVHGLAEARSIARRWVHYNPYGQARVLSGHVTYPCCDKDVVLKRLLNESN